MSRALPVLVALLALTLTPAASAIELAGNDLIIPIAGRTPGANGSFWESDLVLTNLSPEYAILRVTVETWIAGEKLSFDVDIPALGTITIEDFVRTRFGRDTAIGFVRVSNALPDAQLSARARVYTTGDVGQSVPGLPIAALARESLIPGLTGTTGNRSNLGIANPNATPADITLELLGSEGQRLALKSIQLAAHAIIQQEIGAAFQPHLTRGDVTVRVTSSLPVATYGSIIRTGSGDASFILGTTTRKSPDFTVNPTCSDPAPLIFPPGPVRPGWVITYKAGTDTKTVTPALMQKYGFAPTFTIGIYVATALTPEMIAGLRCEPPVRSISQGSHVSLDE
ncbi:MAG TPA: hypothetical protein VGQ76_04130 [Thermoanaerobaculia bacterium]|jgi:hypothetical protein|nr:hypothetical protein [Thermoanaerobaculia bacterium]